MRVRRALGLLAPWWWIALLAVAIAFPFVERRIYYHVLGFSVLVAATNATSWNILGGYTGYKSLGHSAFFGLGAYLVAITHVRWGWDPLWSSPLLALVVLVVALGLGWIMLRATGATFVIATIAMLLIFRLLVLNLGDLSGGAPGISQPLPPWTGDFVQLPLYLYILGCLALAMLTSAFIKRSRFGLGLQAIREDEAKAESVGIQTTAYKVAAFGISAYFVALAGGIWSYRLIHISPAHAFDILVSVDMVLMTMLGGIGTVWGPVLGALILVPAADYTRLTFGATQIHTTLLGVLMLLIVVFMPRGVLPTLRDAIRRRLGSPTALARARSMAELSERESGRPPDGEGAPTASRIGET